MRKIFTGAGAITMAALLATACDTSTRANDGKTALTAGATPADTTGSAAKTAETPAADAAADGAAAAAAEKTAGPNAERGAATASRESAPAARAYRDLTIPAGTTLSVRLNTPVASDTSRVEQRVDGTLTRDVRIGGLEALGAGSTLRGVVTNAERSGRVKGRANVAFKFDHIAANGTVYPISTRTVSRVAPATKKRDAATIGIPAAGGAIIGGIVGGGDGAVKGGAIGGAAGTAAVLSTRGKEVRLAPGTTVSVRLARALTVRVPVR